MATERVTTTPWWFWVIAAASLVWNSGGATDWVMTKTHNAAYLAATTPAQAAFMASYPAWAEVAWFCGVWGAVLGSILLLLRSRHAVAVLAVSLAGLVAGTVYQFAVSDMPATMRTPGATAFTATLWAVAIALIWFAARMRSRGIVR